MDNVVIVIILFGIGSVAGAIMLAIYLSSSAKTKLETAKSADEVAHRLGLKYELEPEKRVESSMGGLVKSWDIVNWRIGGELNNRQVKLESICTRSTGQRSLDIPHYVLTVTCKTPPGLHVMIIKARSSYQKEGYKESWFPHPRSSKEKLFVKVKGDSDPTFIQSMDIIEVMTGEGWPARLEIKEGLIELYYVFGPDRMSVDPDIVERAFNACVELAEKFESSVH